MASRGHWQKLAEKQDQEKFSLTQLSSLLLCPLGSSSHTAKPTPSSMDRKEKSLHHIIFRIPEPELEELDAKVGKA